MNRDYNVYTKEFAVKSRSVVIEGGGKSYYYDMNGDVMCADASYERIIGRSFYILSYQSYAEGAELKTFWEADPSIPELQKMTEQSIEAKELYSHFWGGSQ